MARLLSWPDGVGIDLLEVVDDPNIRNSGSNTASDGSERLFAGIGQVWAFRVGVPILKNLKARRVRGIQDGLMDGANAMRFQYFDPDQMTPAEAGLDVSPNLTWRDRITVPWSNGMNWSNGQPWRVRYPVVKVAASASFGETIVSLQDEFWGHSLGFGDRFGFFPFHLGLYQVTEVIVPGTYRVKWSLRAAITYSADPSEVTYATLFPTLALRPIKVGAARPGARRPAHVEGSEMILSEVIDPYVRRDFAG
ncbi:hypothetical protein [Nitratireductor sp. StC3]|uniref:hypothetical protein n=1 Tax=Nitratireductor sp. StC3 TaxID=2126741 RepID=UPI000D0CF435|nr:hypothetical protein [Nitratireductor sp. StC3]PSM18216.1 hypothetical protein C7T96_10115 [Nitratireductor sp. StC3]